MAAPLKGLPPGFVLDEPDTGGLPPGFVLDEPAPAPEESFGQRVLGGAASTADIIAESVPGMAAMVAYPFRRAAGVVTGETAEDIAASQERVLSYLSAPVGRATGTAESASYQNNLARQALGFVAENMDKGADWISGQTGLPKPDVTNMMQVVASAAPLKVPGARTAGKITQSAVNKARDILDPKTKFYMDIAEGRAPELIAAARRPEAEIIPGVRPTFAQATADVGLPRVAAVGEQAERLQPTAAIALRDAQEAARVGELKKIERTPEKRKLAEDVREQRAGPLYQAAETAGDVVDIKPVIKGIDELTRKNPGNKALLNALAEIRKGLTKPVKQKVATVTPSGKLKMVEKTVMKPRVNAKEISSSLDGIKAALAKEDNKFIKGELSQIKDDLTAAIPSMQEAQAAFRKGSKPINQMDVGTYLREKLEAAVPEGRQRAGVFAEAVRNAPLTIKRALDNTPRYSDLTDVLSPAQKANVDRVVMDLSRDARVKELAQLGRETAPVLKQTVGDLTLPPFFKAVVTISNEILRRLQGKINEKIAMDIALEFLDADRAAAALETAMRRSAPRASTPRRTSGPISRAVKRAPAVTAPNQMNNQENRNAMAR